MLSEFFWEIFVTISSNIPGGIKSIIDTDFPSVLNRDIFGKVFGVILGLITFGNFGNRDCWNIWGTAAETLTEVSNEIPVQISGPNNGGISDDIIG